MRKFAGILTRLSVVGLVLLMAAIACKKNMPAIPISPKITAINPTSGIAGIQVTITGTNFKTNPTDNTVKFSGVVAAVTSATATSLVVNAPAAGGTGPISVTTTDGALLSLATTYNGGEAYSIFVSGTNVYVAGSQWSMASGGNSIATYWKNGAAVTLTTVVNNDVASAVYVSGGDVYIAGSDGAAGKYWKNGAAHLLNVPNASYPATPLSMYVTGTDVYVAGYYTNLAKYWKNGTMVDLTSTTAGGSTAEYATGIAGKGTDIYICGNDVSKGYGYWKNGVFTALPGAGIVNGIFVN